MQQQQRVQAMMGRILAMQWSMPADVPITPECRDLLVRLLEADPARRATMEQISQHPWFLQNLPPVRRRPRLSRAGWGLQLLPPFRLRTSGCCARVVLGLPGSE